MLRVDNVNLLAAVNTATTLYTVPSGLKLTPSNFKIIITNTNQSVVFGTAPIFWVTNNAGVRCMNELALTTGRTIVNGDVFASAGSFGAATQRVLCTDTLSLRVHTASSGGTQSSMLATVIVTGELYS
jgi:hypothetical protein